MHGGRGEMSTGGWQGTNNAVAMSPCTTCSSLTARARLRAGSLHSPAQKWFTKTLPLHWMPWI